MAILGSTDRGLGRYQLTLDHNPSSVATDGLAGSMAHFTTEDTIWIKTDDGETTSWIQLRDAANVTAGLAIAFSGNLAGDTTVQEALDTIDGLDLTAGKSQFFPVAGNTTNYGTYFVQDAGSNQNGYITFRVPARYGSDMTVKLLGIVDPSSASTARNIDFYTNYGADGEAYNNHAQSDTTTTYDLSAASNEIYTFDLTYLFTDISPGDVCGINVKHNSIGSSIYYLGVEIVYNE